MQEVNTVTISLERYEELRQREIDLMNNIVCIKKETKFFYQDKKKNFHSDSFDKKIEIEYKGKDAIIKEIIKDNGIYLEKINELEETIKRISSR